MFSCAKLAQGSLFDKTFHMVAELLSLQSQLRYNDLVGLQQLLMLMTQHRKKANVNFTINVPGTTGVLLTWEQGSCSTKSAHITIMPTTKTATQNGIGNLDNLWLPLLWNHRVWKWKVKAWLEKPEQEKNTLTLEQRSEVDDASGRSVLYLKRPEVIKMLKKAAADEKETVKMLSSRSFTETPRTIGALSVGPWVSKIHRWKVEDGSMSV